MLEYHKCRIESVYIPNLRLSLKDCENIFNDDDNDSFASARRELKDLRHITFHRTEIDQKLSDRHNALIVKAHELRMVKAIEELLQNSPKASAKTRRLWVDICFLGRLRFAFQKFKEIALELPSFSKVNMIPVPRDTAGQIALQNSLTLKQVFELLNLRLNPSTIKCVIGRRWTIATAEREFAKLQRQKLNLHAEVQMVLYFSQNGQLFSRLFPYFGCSKYSCFMCWHFLQAHGKISTKGCHGRLFGP